MVMLWIKMWTESRRRLPTYLLVGGSGLNVVHACNFFFCFFFLWKKKKKSTRHVYQWSDGFEVLNVLSRGLMDLKFGHASQRSDGIGIWTCFPEVHWNWILDVFPRGSMDLNLDMLPRGPIDWNLDMLPKGLMVWSLDVLFRGPMDLKFGHAS